MNELTKISLILGLIVITLFPLISAINGEDLVAEENSCVNETLRIAELVYLNNTLNENLTSCNENLSEYTELYLSKEVNITNRELISLTQNIFYLQQNITDLHTEIGELKQKISYFNFTIEITFALITVTLLGSLLKWINKKYKITQKFKRIETTINQ